MYSRQEASMIRKKFWTNFGIYLRPVKGAGGDTINWLNYKTGLRHIYFRMDAGTEEATIDIELRHPDLDTQEYYFSRLQQLKTVLEGATGEPWEWQPRWEEEGKIISRVIKRLSGVNIFREDDWPAIISFFKPRIIALDKFWEMAKDVFDEGQ